jgi:hypothetical protein
MEMMTLDEARGKRWVKSAANSNNAEPFGQGGNCAKLPAFPRHPLHERCE